MSLWDKLGRSRLFRQPNWMMPGLALKRWLSISLLGFLLVVFGCALLLNLQPVASTIRLLHQIAEYVPSSLSGPVLLLFGFYCLYLGAKKTYRTVYSVISPDAPDKSLLETLYRRSLLANGPNIVAIGGGTGLSTLLRGIKHYTDNITAVVTVGDDGGSSGRLRKEQGVIPPGDIRNCIAALADEERLLTELFQYRFKIGQGLEGHSFGNLFLTAMCRITGDMFSAIKESSKVLNIRGRVLPSTLDSVVLNAELADGAIVTGESEIPKAHSRIIRLWSEPENTVPLPEVITAIQKAEIIVLGPGSLYTSVLPNLLIDEIAHAISRSEAPKIYVCNIMTQPGETDGYSVSEHIRAILDHCRYPNMLDSVLVNNWLPDDLVRKYGESHYQPVALDLSVCQELDIEVIQKLLVDRKNTSSIRHDPDRLAQAIIDWFKREYRKKTRRPAGSDSKYIRTAPSSKLVAVPPPADWLKTSLN